MNGPRNPTERSARKRDQPSPNTRKGGADQDKTLPDRRSTATEKQSERIVNQDEQLKVVNNREDNAQSASAAPADEKQPASAAENNNERLEAGYDNSEVHPRPPKVN